MLPAIDKNFCSACDNFTGPEHPDPGSPKVRSQVLLWNTSVLHIIVEQKWINIHQCDKRNRQNGNDTLVICYPGHLKTSTETWWKNSPSLFPVSTLFRKHWERSPVDFFPLLHVCISGHLVTQTMWLYKTSRNFAKAWFWTHKLHPNNLAWNSEQLKFTTQERQDRTIAPNIHDTSRATGICNATHLLPEDVVTEGVIHLQGLLKIQFWDYLLSR